MNSDDKCGRRVLRISSPETGSFGRRSGDRRASDCQPLWRFRHSASPPALSLASPGVDLTEETPIPMTQSRYDEDVFEILGASRLSMKRVSDVCTRYSWSLLNRGFSSEPCEGALHNPGEPADLGGSLLTFDDVPLGHACATEPVPGL
jgi:hypothetical protein